MFDDNIKVKWGYMGVNIEINNKGSFDCEELSLMEFPSLQKIKDKIKKEKNSGRKPTFGFICHYRGDVFYKSKSDIPSFG